MAELEDELDGEAYPATVLIDGVEYTVFVDIARDGMIEYFQLQDPEGNLFFELDWTTGSLTGQEIRSLVKDNTDSDEPAGEN